MRDRTDSSAKRVPRTTTTAEAMSPRKVALVSILILTAAAVFFVFQARATSEQKNSATTGSEVKAVVESVDQQPSKTEVNVSQQTTKEDNQVTSQQSTTSGNESTSNMSTDVTVNGTHLRVGDNESVHKVIRNSDGTSEVKIQTHSNSNGSNESYLDLNVNYSTSSEVDSETTMID